MRGRFRAAATSRRGRRSKRSWPQALRRPPCLVSFSGGLDSSALLALAVHVARREGLPDPVPATLVFPSSQAADEHAWQERVLDRLGVAEHRRFEFTDELDAVGPVAAPVLRRHGLIWPFNLHFHVPIIESAAGGAVVTGFGGDELGRASSSLWAERAVAARRIGGPRELARVAYALAPGPVKWLREYARGEDYLEGFGFLTEEGRTQLRRRLASEYTIPFGFGRVLRDYLWRSRYFRICRANFQAVADDHDVRMFHPFCEPTVLQALPEGGRFAGMLDRRHIVGELFGDLLPREVVERTSKAVFDDPLWTPTALRFAEEWSGAGLDAQLVDPEAVRRSWLGPDRSTMSTTMLQAAWLADERAAG